MRTIAVVTTILAATLAGSSAHALDSVDHRGDCRKGVPASAGETKESRGGRTVVELVAHGSEYGHHCGQDQGRFAFTELSGDFDVVVRVAAITNGGAMHFKNHPTAAKAGIMAREGNGPSDRYVAIFAVSNDALEHYPDSFHFDLRRAPAAWLGSQPKGEFVYGYANNRGQPQTDMFRRDYPNVWLRLQRKGNGFLAFVSKDGKTWRPTSTPKHDIDFARKLYVGLALGSAPEGHFDARSTVRFDEVRGLVARKARLRSRSGE